MPGRLKYIPASHPGVTDAACEIGESPEPQSGGIASENCESKATSSSHPLPFPLFFTSSACRIPFYHMVGISSLSACI